MQTSTARKPQPGITEGNPDLENKAAPMGEEGIFGKRGSDDAVEVWRDFPEMSELQRKIKKEIRERVNTKPIRLWRKEMR